MPDLGAKIGNKYNLKKDSSIIKSENPRSVYGLYTQEFSNLTPDSVKFYLEALRLGVCFFMSLLFETIRERDLHIGGVCQTRKLAILGKHKLSNLDNYIQCENEEHKKFVISFLKNIKLPSFISDVVEATLEGVSNFEINYKADSAQVIPESIKRIPNYLLVYDDKEDKYYFLDASELDVVQMKIKCSTYSDNIDISKFKKVELPADKLLEVHCLDGNAGNGMRNGVAVPLLWAYLFKAYAVKDWATFLELYAFPAVIALYDELMSEPDKGALKTAIKNFGNDFKFFGPKNADVKFMESNKNSADMYSPYVDYWDTKISIRVLGQNQTTQITDKGTQASATVHDTVRNDIMLSDMILVEQAINELIRKVMDLNFAEIKDYPVFEFPETKSLADKKMLADVYNIIQELGYKVSKEQLEYELDVELEDAEEVKPEDVKGTDEQVKATVLKLLTFAKEKAIESDVNAYLDEIYKQVIPESEGA